MRVAIDHYGERLKASLECDMRNPWRWRPRGEQGRAAWGRFVGWRWLQLSCVVQWYNPPTTR